MTKLCSIEECTNPSHARGWCKAHYLRWRRHGDPAIMKRSRNGAPLEYLRQTVLAYDGDECLPWPFYRSSAGYGYVTRNGKQQPVSRVVCEEAHGPAPAKKMHAAHNCGKGHEGCCNPRHIRWATVKENSADRRIHGTHRSGSQIPAAKLTEEDARTIRDLRGRVSQANLAARYGVLVGAIGAIHRGETWKDA